MAAKAYAGQGRVRENVRQQRVIGRPVLEALWYIADDFIADSPRAHPSGDHRLIFVGLGLLGAGIGAQDKVRGLAACGKLDQQGGTVDADTISENDRRRSEEHTSELQSLMRISYAVFCLKKKIQTIIKAT